jgi:hypothetical protein
MKNPETQNLESALSKHFQLNGEIEELKNLNVSRAQTLEQLETNCDLGDEKALAAIGQLQTFVALLPRRLAAKEQLFTETETEILKTCEGFIATTLGPKIRSLRQRAEAKIRAELKPHFPDAASLDHAVENTAQVLELNNLSFARPLREIHWAGL